MTWVLKKPTFYSCCRGVPSYLVSSSSSSSSTTARARTRSCNSSRAGVQPGKVYCPNALGRHYATVSDAPGSSGSGKSSPSSSRRPPRRRHHHEWPTSAHPTPYDIFDQKRGAPYSKARFYELVKVYHPDRNRHTDSSPSSVSPGDGDDQPFLSNQVRLERYRMVVRANEILCNPSKRRAYDLFGLGWEDHINKGGWDAAAENEDIETRAHRRQASRAWRSEPGNPSMNATWEDWERWYQQQQQPDGGSGSGSGSGNSKKQKPLYMSNEFFVAALCLFVVVGSVGQARRAATNSISMIEVRDGRHEAIHTDMSQKQRELAALSRHERVESFLRQREGWHVGSAVPDYSSSNKGQGEGEGRRQEEEEEEEEEASVRPGSDDSR